MEEGGGEVVMGKRECWELHFVRQLMAAAAAAEMRKLNGGLL